MAGRRSWTFSTLCSGRVFATHRNRHGHARPGSFQYPVFGSSVCNTASTFFVLSVMNFQYPVFGSSVCNYWRSGRRRTCRLNFQYPVFGSSVCNVVQFLGGLSRVALSVPCVRVECLQLHDGLVVPEDDGLSVPCVQVECLQLI